MNLFLKTCWNNILPILRDLKIISGVQYTAMILWHNFGRRLIGNNNKKSYFRKKYHFFFHVFLWKIFNKNQFIAFLFLNLTKQYTAYYLGGIRNTWHDFQISQSKRYIVSSGLSKTNSKEHTYFYCVFSIEENLKY